LLRLERVSKIYPTGEVLRDVTWEVKAGDRIGLVGVNGAGKSTQMRIISGLEEPSSGQVVKQGEPRIVYLQQEFDVDLTRTVRQELFQAFGEAAEVLNRQRQVEEEMASEKAASDPDHLDELIHELGRLQSRFEGLHGYELDARIDKLLPTIGFTPEGAEQLVADYSGGWQMRIALGKVLLQEPDLLLLDEPTNDLDVETLELLEEILTEYQGTLLLVSHDRQFLDNIVTSTLVFEGEGKVKEYVGGYNDWLRQRPVRAVEAPVKVEAKAESVEKPLEKPKRATAKLSYKLQRELDALPDELEAAEAAVEAQQAICSAADFYQGAHEAVAAELAKLAELEQRLEALMERWVELEAMQEG